MSSDSLSTAVKNAAAQPQLLAAVAAAYTDLQSEIDTLKPRCDASGRCCRFEAYGHRLYVSTAELAFFSAVQLNATAPLTRQTAGLPLPQLTTPGATTHSLNSSAPWDGTGCPYQIDNLCTARDARPLGCRIYFCDPAATQWQQEAYERFHCRMKQIHLDFSAPYHYLEWRNALRALNLPF